MMRLKSVTVVAVVVTLHLISVSAFTSYARISKSNDVQLDYRGHELLIASNTIAIRHRNISPRTSTTQLHESPNKKKGGLDEAVRTKLVSESIAPWRTLRLFLYFSLGSGALVGGLITLTGFAAVLSGAKEGNINTEVCTQKKRLT